MGELSHEGTLNLRSPTVPSLLPPHTHHVGGWGHVSLSDTRVSALDPTLWSSFQPCTRQLPMPLGHSLGHLPLGNWFQEVGVSLPGLSL